MADLTGKVAVVTGAGSGVGASTALYLASMGARVCCADREDIEAILEHLTAEATAAFDRIVGLVRGQSRRVAAQDVLGVDVDAQAAT
jgi:NAD(P)-dependent dehydrogenase (short-subunit alcohol dehydrogenase family)